MVGRARQLVPYFRMIFSKRRGDVMVNKEERDAIAAEFGEALNNGGRPAIELPTIEQLKILAKAATQGRWMACRMVHGERGDDLTADELGEYVKNCVAVGGERPFLFVSVEIEGRGVDLCHIGNGPNGPNNAAFIEAVNPATVLALIDHIERLSAGVLAGAVRVESWVPVGLMMPYPGQPVLAHFKNELGKSRMIVAVHYPKFWREADNDNDELPTEYDEKTDQFYWPAGFYEKVECWEDFTFLAVTETITHWHMLPMPPEDPEGIAQL